MLIRTLALACALALAACGKAPSSEAPAPPSAIAASAAAPSAAPDPDLAKLGKEALPGRWVLSETRAAFYYKDEEEEPLIYIDCHRDKGLVAFTLGWDESAPQQNEMQLVTSARAIRIPASGDNEGMSPFVTGTVKIDDPNLDALTAAQQTFGAGIGDKLGVFPWGAGVASVLKKCGV